MTTMFDPAILQNNPAVRGRMITILQAALDAVRPDLAVKAQLHRARQPTVGGRRRRSTWLPAAASLYSAPAKPGPP